MVTQTLAIPEIMRGVHQCTGINILDEGFKEKALEILMVTCCIGTVTAQVIGSVLRE